MLQNTYRVIFKKIFLSFLLLIFLNVFSQFNIQNFSSGNQIQFLEPEFELEDYEDFKLIKNIDLYFNFMGGMALNENKKNFSLLRNKLEKTKNDLNQATTESTNKYNDNLKSTSPTFFFGANINIFYYKYFGLSITYSRFEYLTHELNIINNNPNNSDYFDQTIGYNLYGYGDSYHFSLLYRIPFGIRKDNNIFVILGLGYSYYFSELDLTYNNKVDGSKINENFKGSGHGMNSIFELVVKIGWVNYSFGSMFLFGTIDFDGTSSLISEVPKKIELTQLNPFVFFKIGFNF